MNAPACRFCGEACFCTCRAARLAVVEHERVVWNAAITAAARAADMHAGDCQHFGARAEGLGAQHAAEIIRGLIRKEIQ